MSAKFQLCKFKCYPISTKAITCLPICSVYLTFESSLVCIFSLKYGINSIKIFIFNCALLPLSVCLLTQTCLCTFCSNNRVNHHKIVCLFQSEGRCTILPCPSNTLQQLQKIREHFQNKWNLSKYYYQDCNLIKY